MAGQNAATSRRAVLLGAGVAGAAGLLAACGDGGETGEPSGSQPTATATTGTAASPGGPTSASATPASGTPIAEIPLGGGKILADQGIVVTRPAENEIKAFDTTCPHQGCLVTSIRDGRIVCPCHGSEFFIADGSVAKGPDGGMPLRQGLAPRRVTVTGDRFTVS